MFTTIVANGFVVILPRPPPIINIKTRVRLDRANATSLLGTVNTIDSSLDKIILHLNWERERLRPKSPEELLYYSDDE